MSKSKKELKQALVLGRSSYWGLQLLGSSWSLLCLHLDKVAFWGPGLASVAKAVAAGSELAAQYHYA